MILSTQHCHCYLIDNKDIEEVLSMYQEKDSNKYIAPLLDKSELFYRRFLTNKILANKESPSFWVVRNRADQSLIGTINLNKFATSQYYHIGCHLRREAWNKGFANELMLELLEYAKKEKQLNAVHGIFEKEHFVSQRLLIKLGFKAYESRWVDGKELSVYRLNL